MRPNFVYRYHPEMSHMINCSPECVAASSECLDSVLYSGILYSIKATFLVFMVINFFLLNSIHTTQLKQFFVIIIKIFY